MKRIGLLLVLFAALLLPCGAAEKETAGSCGVNISWRLEDGDQLEEVKFRGSEIQWQALTEVWDEESMGALPVEYGYVLPKITGVPEDLFETGKTTGQEPKNHGKLILLSVVLGVTACVLGLGWCVEKSRKRRGR